jgi:DNA-binding SARP family transcriptional activator/DNA-binding GntR family transcriptional regulator
MEFRILGPLEAIDRGKSLPLGGRKARALLGRLALDARRTVSVQRLVDDLWGEDAPESAAKMVQIHVSQLRKVLPHGVLLTRAPGYVVDVDAEAVDVNRFMRLRGEGRAALTAGDPATAAARFDEALSLWRGPALAEFAEPFARVEGAHLEELRVVCLEERIEADLERRRHADVVGELEALVAHHPLREALHGQLMLALYRSGRQAEALETFARFRRTLDEQLGIEPSNALKALQQGVLTQALDLDLDPAPSLVPAPLRPAPPLRDDFVGRAHELSRLDAALDAAGDARGGVALIAGRAGIGKTRLTNALSEHAHARGATVLDGRCIQLVGTGLPYLPLVDALRPLRGSTALHELPVQLRELPRLLPDLAGRGAADEVDQTRDDLRLRLFEEVLAVLEHLSRAQPLVLVLEDLQWADVSTLDLVAFLAHAVRDRRILLVATYRSEEFRTGKPLHRLVAALVAAGVVDPIELGPLLGAEVEALLAAGGAQLSPEVTEAIVLRSEGNPFFARELLAAGARDGTVLPPALRDILLASVARLDADARGVLRVAAAAGRDVPYRLLAAVTPLHELELADALRQAVEYDVLAADQATGTFRFRHELFAEAVYSTLLPGEREVLHERLARAITEEPGLAVSGATAAEAAQHWAAAGRPIEALAASLQAARDAEVVSGLTEALQHVERVLELWDRVPLAEELAGVALPAVIAWAVELAGVSAHHDEVDARKLIGALVPDQSFDVQAVAAQLGVSAEAAATTLAVLERDGLVERDADDTYRSAPLAVVEARRLYPSVVVMESLAVRQSPPFDRSALDAMTAANDRLRAAGANADAAAAIAADDDFHRQLTARCGNTHLLAALRPVRRALLRYERVYMRDPARIERSVAQHEAIIAALERSDHAEAAQRVRENLAGGLPALTDALGR